MKSNRNKNKETQPGIVKTSWLSLAKTVKLEPGSVQFTEMEKAFYSGAWTIMEILKKLDERPPKDMSELNAQA